MGNHERLLPMVLLVTQLSHTILSKPTEQKCTKLRVEIQNSEWRVYINLPQINVYSCEVTKTKKKFDCRTKAKLETEKMVYYDVTKSCLDMGRKSNNESNTSKYGCNSGYILDVTEKKTVTSSKARVNFKRDQVFLSKNTTCRYSTGFCYDSKQNPKAYVWDTELEDSFVCENLIQLKFDSSKVVKFTLHQEYLVFEGDVDNFAVELVREINLCRGRAWTNNAGVVVTNDTSFLEKLKRQAKEYLSMSDKQSLYQSLVEQCRSTGEVPSFYFCAIVFLLVYVSVHFICSLYNRVNDCRTLSNVEGQMCRCIFQSRINEYLVKNSMVVETKLRSDIEMNKFKEENGRPSYYEIRM